MYLLSFVFWFLLFAVIIGRFFLKKEKRGRVFSGFFINPDRLGSYAEELARSHHLSEKECRPRILIREMDDNFQEISNVYKKLDRQENKVHLSGAAEWLLDNYYIIEEQFKLVRYDLLQAKNIKLKKIEGQEGHVVPRIYLVALELVSHSGAKLSAQIIQEFVDNYQKNSKLTMAELWIMPLMIKIAFIENIRFYCEKIYFSQQQWEKVDYIFSFPAESLDNMIIEAVNSMDKLNVPLVEHLISWMRHEGTVNVDTVTKIERRLEEFEVDIKQVVATEHKNHSLGQLAMENGIVGLKYMATLNWENFFERVSLVEKILLKDPAEIYGQMEFSSRDHYRHQVEKLAKLFGTSETRLASKVLSYAKIAADNEAVDDRTVHVGYFLMGEGVEVLATDLDYAGILNKPQKYAKPLFYGLYLGLAFLVCSLTIFYGFYFSTSGQSWWLATVFSLLFWIPATEIIAPIHNWLLSRFISPAQLPQMDYSKEIPQEAKTMVVIPALLSSEKRGKELIKQLEVHYLANPQDNLFFAVLGDFKDSDQEKTEQDQMILKYMVQEISRLNQKYAATKQLFYYFQRGRQYSEQEDRYMGWEKKRGSLLELNALLLDDVRGSFLYCQKDLQALEEMRYILTLDADTKIPMGMAARLVGTIDHLLNRPSYDPETKKVKRGYGLIQPKISVSLESSNRTFFAKIFAGQGGIDPYEAALSNVYQDYFQESSFTGKGIYDLKIFQQILQGSLPEGKILSHDLLEGNYLRVGLASKLELIDDFPCDYRAYMLRLHRWVRGDWQIIGWLRKQVKNQRDEKVVNPISDLGKWKIIDNLRRSLLPVSQLLLLFAALFFLPGNIYFWLIMVLMPWIVPTVMELANFIFKRGYRNYFVKFHHNLLWGPRRSLLELVFNTWMLPYSAYLMLDAIGRTIFRLSFSHRNLLQWTTAADAEQNLKKDWRSYYFSLSRSLLLFEAVLLFLFLFGSVRPGLIFVLMILGILAPLVAYFSSRPLVKKSYELKEKEAERLLRLAREKWAFYEDFADMYNNYLPPDNYQVDPPKGIAKRTSPTNIGFLLLATLTARDLGFTGTTVMTERVHHVLQTIKKMEKWNGHLYNWYDTSDLKILHPAYISTVDSGNLVAFLMVLAEGMKTYLEQPLWDDNFYQGLICDLKLASLLSVDLKKALTEAQACQGFRLDHFYDLLAVLNKEISSHPDRWYYKFKYDLGKIIAETKTFYPGRDILRKTEKFLQSQDDQEKLACLSFFQESVSVKALLNQYEKLLQADVIKAYPDLEWQEWIDELKRKNYHVKTYYEKVRADIEYVEKLIRETNFAALYSTEKELFSIGYNKETESLTEGYYDLLASEARIASFVAIARQQVPAKHWHKLGRTLTVIDDYVGLLSWTGTMFEYFMPKLIMRNYDNTLLAATYYFVQNAQELYGQKRDVPWGTSESGYYAFDLDLNYQYKAFGVPNLGLKRGLIEDIVVSPYSTLLALDVSPESALENIRKLEEEGMEGEYGFYEAIDFTPKRILKGKTKGIVKSFMAHHVGMGLIALENFLTRDLMVERFHQRAEVKAAEILLQDKLPQRIILSKEYKEKVSVMHRNIEEKPEVVRRYGLPEQRLPNCHLLANGKYSLFMTDRGSGYERYQGCYLNRWRGKYINSFYGQYIFIKDEQELWSLTYDPLPARPGEYEVLFKEDRGIFRRREGDLETELEVLISAEENASIRKIRVTNHSTQDKQIELTTYCELVLHTLEADKAHQAFSNLFVRTEYVEKFKALIASRRPRNEGEKTFWLAQLIVEEEGSETVLEYETDRSKFIGRNRSAIDPQAMTSGKIFESSRGTVLDPILSLRKNLTIKGKESRQVALVTLVNESREELFGSLRKYNISSSVERACDLAWVHAHVESTYLNLDQKELYLYQQMIAPIVFWSCFFREKNRNSIEKNVQDQSYLWRFGISGDLPIVVMVMTEKQNYKMLRTLLRGHEYWQIKDLEVDLVILIEEEVGYKQPIKSNVEEIIFASQVRGKRNNRGGVFLLNLYELDKEALALFYTVARVVIKDDLGTLEKQVNVQERKLVIKDLALDPQKVARTRPVTEMPIVDLEMFNGYGGFEKDDVYAILLKKGMSTPLPWSNVIASPNFGFLITEAGGGYVWAKNSRENKLTPWSNDPVCDPLGEAVYLRDDEDGRYTSLTPSPVRGNDYDIVRHGFGYSNFSSAYNGIRQEMTVFAAPADKAKLTLVNINNLTDQQRKLSLYYYVKPVLGVHQDDSGAYLTSHYHRESSCLTVQNRYRSEYKDDLLYVAASEEITSFTCDESEFLGLGGSLQKPKALRKEELSDFAGCGVQLALVLKIDLVLEAKSNKELALVLGTEDTLAAVQAKAIFYSDLKNVRSSLDQSQAFWQQKLKVIQVKTPDRSLDLMMNGWLLYQNLSCRLWARSAFYQAGGAYGFRDQLQDVLNFAYIDPKIAKQQIRLHCQHQFLEGDVLHWWHSGEPERGIRTKVSDDLLWLPYVTSEYVKITGDTAFLDEVVSYLEGEQLEEGEVEKYLTVRASESKNTIYEHCLSAIEHALKFGSHGLPLMGSGDWNDGMNQVGHQGKGESVWLSWFLIDILQRFVQLAEAKGSDLTAARYRQTREELIRATVENAWDGEWYKRAFFDDGTPLGSKVNDECKIDSLAQSWAVISGGSPEDKSKQAMASLENYLIQNDSGQILLFTPPFDEGGLEPGYIKSYGPGLRENGGQYTHAAIWVIKAMAGLKKQEQAWLLFNMINPLNHANSLMSCGTYKLEPYVMAADIYAVAPHVGRGGWSWYTGASGWMFKVGLEDILGIRKVGEKLYFEPCLPDHWSSCEITYAYESTLYHIEIRQDSGPKTGEKRIILDGVEVEMPYVRLTSRKESCQIEVILN